MPRAGASGGTSEHAEALLLRSVDYAEADRIVTLLTSTHGKLSLLARGARRSKKRFGGALEPFALLDVELTLGRGELGQLRAAEVQRAFTGILRDLPAMNAAGAAFSLLRELLPERAPDPESFASALDLLEALHAGAAKPEQLLVTFQVYAMAVAGFAPRLAACGVCGKQPAEARSAEFDAARGYLVCQADGGARFRLRAALRQRLSQAIAGDWLAAAEGDWEPSDLEDAQRALATFIEHRIARPSSSGPSRTRTD